MFNISKQGSSLLITSNDNSQFPWKDGQMSLPMNSVVYVIDESDYIAFRSASNNDILFTALIDEIQINGTNVTKDDFILQFDNVANSAGGGGGSASAGVNSINGFQGDLTLKSINGQSLIGSGDIEIEGGTAGVNKIIMGDEDYGWNAFSGDIKLTNGWVDLDDDGKSETYDIRVGNNSGSSLWFGFNSTDNSIKIEDNGSRLSFTVNPDILGGGGGSTAGVEAINLGNNIDTNYQKTGIVPVYTSFYDGSYDVAIGGTSFYGLKPVDNSIVLENAGGTVNGNFRCGIKVNEDNFKTINGESIFGSGDITIEGGSSGGGITEETDPIFGAWKNGNAIALGGGATASGNRANAIGTESKATSLWANAFGYQANASQSYSLALGTQAKATAINAIAIGYNTSGATSGAVVIGNAIGVGTVGETSYKTNINNVLKGDTSNYAYVLNEYGNYVRIPTEWTGTQSEYDALGTYYDNITYNIIEG